MSELDQMINAAVKEHLEKVAGDIIKLIQEASKDLADWQRRLDNAETKRKRTFAQGGINVTEQRIRDYKTCLHLIHKQIGKY